MTCRYPTDVLADSPEGQLREAEFSGQASPAPTEPSQGELKKGFVYERVPHVTLKAIANNPAIKEGASRVDIEAAIAQLADTEPLYDRPYLDPKVVRVSGPLPSRAFLRTEY